MRIYKPLIFAFGILFLFAGMAGATTALDPSVVGVGARALGMGRAYTAAAGEPDSIFLNPAALTNLSQWGMTSMYNKLISEVDYVMLGVARPFKPDYFGIGFLSASIGDIQNAVRDPITGRITFEPGTVNYYNDILFLSYAREVFQNTSAGVNLKFFAQGYSGGGDNATGYDVDFGARYKFSDAVTLGFISRNFLPPSMGAKLKWTSGAEESIGTYSRVGINYSQPSYNLAADYEFYPGRSSVPALLKLGAEWWLIPTFALRVGSDQDPLETNLTAGLSFLFSGFKFDYAYHQYGTLSTNTTHTFSLSYGIIKGETEKKPEKKIMNVNINWPADKTIFFDDVVSVEGRVLPKVNRLTSDGMEVFLEKRAFRFSHPLALGKNALKFTAYDANGVQLEQDKVRLLRLERFTDVPAEHWAAVPISVLAMHNIITGYPGNIFKPEGNITRAELCTLLMKSKGQTASGARTKFKDVPASHWAAKYIAQAVSKGVVLGYPGGTFNPNGLISRAEGVAVIARFADLPAPTVLEVPFTDIPGRHWAYKEITSAKQAGLLGFLADKPFEPGKKLTRAEVADILSKTMVIAPKIDEMLDFERGY